MLTGRVESADTAALGFRISGRMIERPVSVGDRVKAGQLVARLEPQNEMNALRSAQAGLAAAQARLTEARNRFERQEILLEQGWTTRAQYDQAEKARQTAIAQVDAAEAQLKSAHDLVGFTELEADAPGIVTAVGAEPGEVVQTGQMIVRLARQDGRDAVFDVPAQVLRSVPGDTVISVHLTDDPAVKTSGRVREVAPQADPVTRTFEVKVGLDDPPETMRLGATVTGTAADRSPADHRDSGHGPDKDQSPAGRVDRRSIEPHRFAAQRRRRALRSGHRHGLAGARYRRDHCHSRRAGASSGAENSRTGIRAVMRFNLSEWALNHRSLVAYLMIVAVAAGLLSYWRLGRNEDPSFIIKTMVVQAAWPGATIEDTLKQVTERLERTLQETPKLDFLRSYTSAGVTTIFVNLKGSATAREVPDIWYHVRKSIGDMRHTLPAGIVGPGFNDEFGDTFGIIYGFTADGFTFRELRDHVEDVRSKLLHVPDVSKIEILGAQDERIFVEFSMKELATLGIDRSALDPRSAGAERRAPWRDDRNRRRDAVAARIRLVPVGAGSGERQFRSRRSHAALERHRANPARLMPIHLSRCFASTASRRSASRSRCATAATSWPWARTSSAPWRRRRRTSRSASSRSSSRIRR